MGKVFVHGNIPPSGAEERAREKARMLEPAGMFPAYEILADAGINVPLEGLHERSLQAKGGRHRRGPGPANLGIHFVGQYVHMGNDVT